MGFKSLTNQNLSNNNSTNNSNNFKIGGLIFDNIDDYLLLKNLDNNINQTCELIKDDCFAMEEYFNKFKKVNVRETYVEAAEELDGLFENTTQLLYYECDSYSIEYKVASCFFNKINILEYLDSDDD